MAGLHVAVALFDERRWILLVRQGYGELLWSLPGGGVEPEESPVAAAIRETREESGFDIRVTGFVGVYAAPQRDMLSLLFEGEIIAHNSWRATNEITAMKFFARDQLPHTMSDRMRLRISNAFDSIRGTYHDGDSRENSADFNQR